MARLKNYGFKVGDILRLSACGLRTLKIPVRGDDNKFVTVIGIEELNHPNGEVETYFVVRDNATGKSYKQNLKFGLGEKQVYISGLSGRCFTGKIYSRI